jgi:hypothetical protein
LVLVKYKTDPSVYSTSAFALPEFPDKEPNDTVKLEFAVTALETVVTAACTESLTQALMRFFAAVGSPLFATVVSCE